MDKPTIIFFSGWSSLPRQSYNPLLKRFEKQGYQTHTVPYSLGGTGSIKQTAKLAFNYLGEKMFAHDYSPPSVFIGHSMGGLVARYLIQKLGDIVPDAYVSIGTPHNGVKFPDVLPHWGPFASAKEMKAGSIFLERLNALEWPTGVSPLNLQASWDLIVPERSSTVSWAENVKIPYVEHAGILWSERTFWEIYSFLNY